MFKIVTFFIITLFARLCMRFGILLTCGKHLHDHIILLMEVWAHTTLKCLFFTLTVMKRSCICVSVRDIDFVSHRRLGTNCVSLWFTLFLAYLHNDPLCASYKALLRMSNLFFQCLYQLWYLPLIQKKHKADNSPPFSLVMKIHKIYIPRLKVASIEICVVSRVSADMNRPQGHES